MSEMTIGSSTLRESRRFSSIRYPLAIDLFQGRLAQENSFAKHVDQMVRQLLLTSPGERINRPDFGCGLKRMLFEPNSEVAASLAQVLVSESLNRWLGSVLSVNHVRVESREEKLEVHISYTLKTSRETRYLDAEVGP